MRIELLGLTELSEFKEARGEVHGLDLTPTNLPCKKLEKEITIRNAIRLFSMVTHRLYSSSFLDYLIIGFYV